MAGREILTLDIATNTGWCRGEPGGKLIHGSRQIAPEGASSAEVLAATIVWLNNTVLAGFRPRIVVFEAPLYMSGKTNFNTTRRLIGMVGIVEAVCYLKGIYEVREANVQDVRQQVFGFRTVKSGDPKERVMREVRRLGYDPVDDNAADAIVLHLYAASIYAGRS